MIMNIKVIFSSENLAGEYQTVYYYLIQNEYKISKTKLE